MQVQLESQRNAKTAVGKASPAQALAAVRAWASSWPTLPGLSRLGSLAGLSKVGLMGSGKGRAVTAVLLGPTCAVVRLEARGNGLHLVAAETTQIGDLGQGAGELARWKPLFRDSTGLLVLRSEDRFLATLDKPEVPDSELNLAVRWPMGEALSAEPEQLLTTALSLPRANEAARAQVLGIATRIEVVQAQLATLRQAGIDLRSIDVVDSALRGMALLQPELPASAVAVALVGNTMSIGLIQQGQICALRSVPLPERDGHADAELAEQLALNARRTFDHYERQAMLSQRSADGATPMAIGRALASVGSLSQYGLETFCSALPDAPQLLDLTALMHLSPELSARCVGHDELTALACVAATRLFDTGPVAAKPLPLAALASAAVSAAATSSAAALAKEQAPKATSTPPAPPAPAAELRADVRTAVGTDVSTGDITSVHTAFRPENRSEPLADLDFHATPAPDPSDTAGAATNPQPGKVFV